MAERLDEDGRCIPTGLLPAQCGCRDHRGGEVITDDLDSLTHDAPEPIAWASQTLVAKFEGRCAGCGSPFPVGATIRYALYPDETDRLVADCCLEGLPHLTRQFAEVDTHHRGGRRP